MKLYGSYTSPFVRHCRVALAQEGLAHEFVEADYDMSAKLSPTAKVPFLTYGADNGGGERMLTDSGSIVKYIRDQSGGGGFLADVDDYETFAMTNTVLDSAINMFLLESEGFTPAQIKYLTRQKNRVENGLKALNQRIDPALGITRDGALRCACFLDWALFRKRASLEGLDNLRELLAVANRNEAFAATAPPAG